MKKTEPIPSAADIIAEEIETLSEGMKKLLNSKLSERAIILLIQDACPLLYGRSPIGRTQIREVLHAAANLKEYFVKKKKDLDKRISTQTGDPNKG